MKPERLTQSLGAMLLLALLATPDAAHAYIGPGAGLSLIGAFLALLATLGTVLLFLVAWPMRRLARRRSAQRRAAARRGQTIAR